MNIRLKEGLFVASVFIATLIAICTYPFVREVSAQAPPIQRNFFTTNVNPTITNIATNTFTFAVTNLIITNSDGSFFFFELGPDTCLVWSATNGVAYRICLKGDGSEFFLGQIGPVLVNAARLRFFSNGLTEFQTVLGQLTNVAFQVVGPNSLGNPVWFSVKTNSGFTGTGANVLTDDGLYKPATNVGSLTVNNLFVTNLTVVSNLTSILNTFLNQSFITNLTVISNLFSIQNSHLNNTFITNLTVVSNFYSIANSFVNSLVVTNLFNILSNSFIFNNTTITNINQRPTYNTNISGLVDNALSMHQSSEVQATMTNNLSTGSNITNTYTLTNLTKNASLSLSLYGASAPSTNYIIVQVPSGSAIRWLNATGGASAFSVTSNKFGVASFWCDRETNVMACFRESQ